MKPRTLLILLAVVLGLGAFIWFYERELPSSEERAELEKKVLRLEKDEITGVVLQSQAGTVEIVREKDTKDTKESKDEKDAEKDEEDVLSPEPEGVWRIVRPLQAQADTFAVDGLLQSLVDLESSRTLEDVKPGEVGLDRPRATVRLKTAEGETVLKIGAAVPTGGELIAGVGNQAFVVGDTVLADLQKPAGEWRDKRVFWGERDQVQRITLVSGGQRVVLARRGDTFRLESPVSDAASRDRIDDLFGELSGLTAETFVDRLDRPLAEMGLQPPRAAVEVAYGQGTTPTRIELGAASAEPAEALPGEPAPATPEAKPIYARVDGQLLEARTRLAEMAARPLAEWRAQALSSLQVNEVESATVRDAVGSLALSRSGTDWKRGEEVISYLPVSDFLFTLAGAEADRLLSPEEVATLGLNLGKPVLEVALKPKTGEPETLSLYPAVAAGVPARVSGRGVVLLLPAGKLGEIQGKLAEIRKAGPVEKK